MGNNIQTFEVRVEVERKGSMHFSSHVSAYITNKITKMFHIDARTQEQARRKAEKHGRPISVRKADIGKMSFNIETMLQRQPYGVSSPYLNAVAMDEMIWRKKGGRAERMEDRKKNRG